MKYILFLFIALFSIQSYAVDQGDWFLQRQISVGDGKNAYGKKIYGKGARAVMEEVPIKGTTQTEVRELIKRSIAVDKPTPTKVGSSMLKRIYSPQAIIGTAAVTGLLGAIGWVMEDGVYVKLKYNKDYDFPNDLNLYEYQKIDGSYAPFNDVLNEYVSKVKERKSGLFAYDEVLIKEFIYTNPTNVQIKYDARMCTSSCSPATTYSYSNIWRYGQLYNFYGRYKGTPPEPIKVPLTAAILGTIMLGVGYSDPAGDKSAESIVNDGDYTGVKETYEHDPSGVGDELADVMDDKLKNAKPTDDDEPSYIGDPKYDDTPLSDDRDDSSDRSWDEKGDEATGGTEPEKDPETGEPTGNQSITLKFPLFCAWASKMCLWYDDWKASDKVYKDHITKTEEHQTEEKTFWQTTKEWFDWTKEEPEENEENDQPEPDDQGIFSRTFDTNFTLSNQCPPDIPISFESPYLSGNFTFSMNWLCIIFTFIGYPLVFLSHCIGIWILYEAAIQKQIKW